MKTNDTVARIVEIMFQDVEMNDEVAAIRDEIMNNCQERYMDLVSSGVAADDAVAAVIDSLKGMEDVLAPYQRKSQRHAETDEPGELDDKLDEWTGEQHMVFAAQMVHEINVTLINEDVSMEASDDDFYHVLWDDNNDVRIKAELSDGVLRIVREAVEAPKAKKEHFEIPREDMANFIKTEAGKIEINMDNISRAMKSLGDKIKLQFSNGLNIGFGPSTGRVIIQVPENAMPHVKLLTTSGDIDVQNVALNDLNITSTSGDINIGLDEDAYLKRIELRTTSGDIDVTAYTQEMTATSTSGDVEVEGCVNLLAVSTISGDIDVRANVQNMTFKAVSGDVDLRFDSDEINNVQGSTISGDIEIDLPDSIGTIAINTQTRSGDVTTCHHANGVGPTVTGSVTSMSGDIRIT